MSKNVAWNWEKVKSNYWKEPSEDLYYYLSRWKKMKFKDFLDLGCGIGRHSIMFAKEGFNTTGYDLSSSGLEILKNEAIKQNVNIDSIKGNASKLPFMNDSFDCILAYHSIYHTDTKGIQDSLYEINRIIKNEGELYVTFISKSSPSFSNSKYAKIDSNSNLKPEEDGSILPHFYINYNEIKNLLKGFEILKIRHIEEYFVGKISYHYYVHAKKI